MFAGGPKIIVTPLVSHIYNSLAEKFDLTRERVDFLYNLYPPPLVPPRGFH